MERISVNEIIQSPGEEYELLKEAIKQELHCAQPGIVQAYNEKEQTVTVELAIRTIIKGQAVRPPLLSDVPVFFPGGVDNAITFPVKKGDECLVVFADSCIDAWFQNSGSSVPISVRKHDLSDGFAFVGFRSRRNALDDPEKYQPVNIKTVMEKVYPVGAVYFSTKPTYPGDLFGGTWEVMPQMLMYCWKRVS